jgi:hypothetical protein
LFGIHAPQSQLWRTQTGKLCQVSQAARIKGLGGTGPDSSQEKQADPQSRRKTSAPATVARLRSRPEEAHTAMRCRAAK